MKTVISAEWEMAAKSLNSMIDWDKLKIAEEKAFQELKEAYPEFIKSCNLLEYKND